MSVDILVKREMLQFDPLELVAAAAAQVWDPRTFMPSSKASSNPQNSYSLC